MNRQSVVCTKGHQICTVVATDEFIDVILLDPNGVVSDTRKYDANESDEVNAFVKKLVNAHMGRIDIGG